MYLHLCEGKPFEGDWQRMKHKGDKSYHPDLWSRSPYVTNEQYGKRKEKEKVEDKLDEIYKKILELNHKKFVIKKKAKLKTLQDQQSEISKEYDQFKNVHNGLVGGTLKRLDDVSIDFKDWESNSSRDNNFKASVIEFDMGGSHVFQLLYGDNTYDERNVYTTYGLVIPSEKSGEIVPQIRNNLAVLIDLFRAQFPNCDNSEGTLKIREDSGNVLNEQYKKMIVTK